MANSPVSSPEQRTVWAFWLACLLAALAGAAPFVLGGGSSRFGGALIPFAFGAIALGACALLYSQGRLLATALYFIAGLAIVYGILGMLAVPLRLAVLGTCAPEPAACGSGFERPLTGGETNALGFAIGIGIVAILTGFFGLLTLYRRQAASPTPSAPPARRIAPVSEKAPPAAVAVAPAPAAAQVPEPVPEPEPPPEAPAPQPELAAPVDALELPAVGTPDRVEVPAPAPQRKPRKPRAPKAPPPPPPATPDTDASA